LYIWSEPILVVGLRSTAKNGDKEDRGEILGLEQAKSVDVVEPNKLTNILIQSKNICQPADPCYDVSDRQQRKQKIKLYSAIQISKVRKKKYCF